MKKKTLKKSILAFVLVVCLLFSAVGCSSGSTDSSAETTTAYEKIFPDSSSNVIDVKIDIDEDDWTDLLKNAEDEEYYEADVTVNGEKAEDVGIRAKGNSSLKSIASSDSDRYSFKIKTDEYVDDQTLDGLDMFVLNSQFSDPSYMREYLTYMTASEIGLTTPELVYTNVYVNDELFGFYLCVESYDDSFVERITDDKNAVLYKADSETNTLKSDDDASGFDVKYGEDDGNTNVQNLIEVLNSTTEDNTDDLEAILDVDSVLKSAALNTIMGNYDSYSGSKAHNYYLLYRDGQFEYIAWDYNMSIGGFPQDNGASVSVDIEEPIYSTTMDERPLISNLLAIDTYNDQYLEYVDQLTDYLGDFESQVSDVDSLISDYVKNDPSSFYEFTDYETSIKASDVDLTELASDSSAKGEKRQMPPAQAQNGDTSETGNQPPADAPTGDAANQPPADAPTGDTATTDSTNAAHPQMGNGQQGGNDQASQDKVSIIDYITQRLAQISEQLNS